jgi:hypothetical protein
MRKRAQAAMSFVARYLILKIGIAIYRYPLGAAVAFAVRMPEGITVLRLFTDAEQAATTWREVWQAPSPRPRCRPRNTAKRKLGGAQRLGIRASAADASAPKEPNYARRGRGCD